VTPPLNSRLKILHVITDLRVGGESKLLVRSIADLPMFEHLVSCLAVTSDPVNAPVDLRAEVETLGVQVVDLGVLRTKPLSVPRAFVRLLQLTRRERPDIVHSTLIHANLLTQPLAWTGCRVLCSHGVTKPWRREWHREFERRMGKRAIFIVNARAVEQILVDAGIDRARIRVLYYGVDCEHFGPDGERADVAGDPLLLGVGRLHLQKGFRDLLAAAALLPGHPRVMLLGDGALGEALLSHARALDVSLTIVPAVGDIAPYLRRAAVVVLPSLWEGLPNVLLEALATGCSVVASDLPGHREVIRDGENGLLAAPGDVSALAAAIGRALSDNGSLGAMGRQTMLKEFRWDAYLERRRVLYESVASIPRRAIVGHS
jgi:glycosyltransferase involved in cell wall biosynthesis